jgi:uroporphyrinogen decarboxylase
MMEGGSAEKFTKAKALFDSDKKTFFTLMEKLTAAVTAYLQMQIAAGVDALQIFDSHGGHLPVGEFQEASGRWMRDIIANLRSKVPVIVFSLGTHGNWNDLSATGANVLGVDWQFSLAEARRILPENTGIQGNLNPALLAGAAPEKVAAETNRLLAEMRGRNGHIFNLGHGVPPAAKLENIAALVETVRNFK